MAIIKDKDITTELRGALIEVKEAMEGKRKLNTLDWLTEELKKTRIYRREMPHSTSFTLNNVFFLDNLFFLPNIHYLCKLK